MLLQFIVLLYVLTAHTFAWTIPTALQFRCRHAFDVGQNGFGPSGATLYTLHIVGWLYSAVQLITSVARIFVN
jgi:hypothetical protein